MSTCRFCAVRPAIYQRVPTPWGVADLCERCGRGVRLTTRRAERRKSTLRATVRDAGPLADHVAAVRGRAMQRVFDFLYPPNDTGGPGTAARA